MTDDTPRIKRSEGITVEITITDHTPGEDETETVTQTIGEKEIEASDATDMIGRTTEFALKLALEEGGVFDRRDFPTTYTSEPGTLAAELDAWRENEPEPETGYIPSPRVMDPPLFRPGDVVTDPASPRFGMPVFTPGSETSEAIRTVAEAAAEYTVTGDPTGEVKITAVDEDGETIVDDPIVDVDLSDIETSGLHGVGTKADRRERFFSPEEIAEAGPISTAHKPMDPEAVSHPPAGFGEREYWVGTGDAPEPEPTPEPDWADVTRYANWLLDGSGGGVEPEVIAAQVPEGVNVAAHERTGGVTQVEIQPEPSVHSRAGAVDAGKTLDLLSRLVPPVDNWERDPPEVKGAAASAEPPHMAAGPDVDWNDVATFTDWLLKCTGAGIHPEEVADTAPDGVRVDTWDKIDGSFQVQIAPDHDHDYTPSPAEVLDAIAWLTPNPATWERDPPDAAKPAITRSGDLDTDPVVEPGVHRPTAEEHASMLGDALDRMKEEAEGDDS